MGEERPCSDLLQDAAKGRLVLVYEVEQVGGEVHGWYRRAMILPSGSPTFAGVDEYHENRGQSGWWSEWHQGWRRWCRGQPRSSWTSVVVSGRRRQIMILSGVRRDLCGPRRELAKSSTTSWADRRRAQAAPPGWKVLRHGLVKPVFGESGTNDSAERRVGRPRRHVADERAQGSFKRAFVAAGQRHQFRDIGDWPVDEGDEIVQRFGVACRRLANAARIRGSLAGGANGTGMGGGGVVGGTGDGRQ